MNFLSALGYPELAGKKVIVRVDFNVPFDSEGITDDYRIRSHQDTISFLLNHGASVALISHLGAGHSFKELVPQISRSLGRKINFVEKVKNLSTKAEDGLVLLENLRHFPGEVKNDRHFSRELANGFDLYINDAFGSAHRGHASIVALAGELPAYAGFLIEREIEVLDSALRAPVAGKILILGGSKIGTKLPLINNFLDKAEKILIGGAIANNFFKARGLDIGQSVFEKDNLVGLTKLLEKEQIIIPTDILTTDSFDRPTTLKPQILGDISGHEAIVDIGLDTAESYAEVIRSAKTVIFNGPMGLFEKSEFATGTQIIAQAIRSTSAYTIIGGGDTVLAMRRLASLNQVNFVSTGGGAMLAFLAGEELPGLKVLNYY
ncbi:MAG: phosphoglycerate kinase [Candidatus Yanofskybacteria bacterium CG10_big_fil_rev_8_21_14_0_10_46_23]|uniref:Phosphoglycerate kinase n=1 Tax=Candidatus Yanofskybacteria bacterium CG10_big_fil_rev_8_21_14_0_10_46_23 TaxID=1975098 RepID=A0A2H0R3T2_9BACT|nr:MAG: phosphoglycerate kinase [Candidatus Yanofskybacteria bacterium CG10_big_fil_rev_8_21_14_0_10_46_23]